MALVSGVWADLVPEGESLPAIRYFPLSNPDVNTFNGYRVLATGRYVVCGVARSGDFGDLVPVADRLDALLGRAAVAARGITIVSCIREEVYRQTEIQPDVQFRHLGGIYMVQASS